MKALQRRLLSSLSSFEEVEKVSKIQIDQNGKASTSTSTFGSFSAAYLFKIERTKTQRCNVALVVD